MKWISDMLDINERDLAFVLAAAFSSGFLLGAFAVVELMKGFTK